MLIGLTRSAGRWRRAVIAHGRRSSRGAVMLEFAMALPVLLVMVGGVYDCTQIFNTWRRMALAATAASEIATHWGAQADPNPDPDKNGAWENTLTPDQVQEAENTIFAYFPAWRNSGDFAVTMSSFDIEPTGCGASPCAKMAWSAASALGQPTRRPCGGPVSAAPPNTAIGASNTLPLGVISGAVPVLVVDVTYSYNPVFLKMITGPIQMTRSSYQALRVASDTGAPANEAAYMTYGIGTNDHSVLCPGYSR